MDFTFARLAKLEALFLFDAFNPAPSRNPETQKRFRNDSETIRQKWVATGQAKTNEPTNCCNCGDGWWKQWLLGKGKSKSKINSHSNRCSDGSCKRQLQTWRASSTEQGARGKQQAARGRRGGTECIDWIGWDYDCRGLRATPSPTPTPTAAPTAAMSFT